MELTPLVRPAVRPESSAVGRTEVVDEVYSIRLDEVAGIVRIAHVALENAADVDRYIAGLAEVVQTARQRFGKALVLADLRDAPVRPKEVADRLRVRNQQLYRPGERVALLVESSLLKMQLRRTLVPDFQNIFMSQSAAEMWLSAAA